MKSQTPAVNLDLFNQAKEYFLPKPVINLARTGSIAERLKYILSVKIVTVYEMCELCQVTQHDVITFLFKYNQKLIIYTYFEFKNYYFTTSGKTPNFIR